METKQDWITAVCRDPHDDQLRLIFADWLDEQGTESDAKQAQFIRMDIEYENKFPRSFRPRNQFPVDLRNYWIEHNTKRTKLGLDGCVEWYPTPISLIPVVSRGFVGEVRCTQAAFLEHAKILFDRNPIEKVVLTDREPRIDHSYDSSRYYWLSDGVAWAFQSANTSHSIMDPFSSHWEMTHQAALDWLSDRCVAYGRKQVGLPPLKSHSS